jgi:hypothetical protein
MHVIIASCGPGQMPGHTASVSKQWLSLESKAGGRAMRWCRCEPLLQCVADWPHP